MRVKSNWFQSGRSKTPQEIAGAAASIVWRIALNMLNQMRRADFDIAVGPQYFEFLAEVAIFLVLVGDRIAYRHLNDEDRPVFTSTLANRVGEHLGENRAEFLDGDMPTHKANFIARLNSRADEYSRYDYEKGGENFSFVRGLGLFLEEVMDERDRKWVVDQVMAVEAPEAIETLEKAMSGLLELEPRRPRSAGHGGGE